jgi:hypothetical protein
MRRRGSDVSSCEPLTAGDRALVASPQESNVSGDRTELRAQTRQLLDGPLKHVRVAALAAVLLPLASVAATPAAVQDQCASGGVCGTVFNDLNNNGVQDVGEPGIENGAVFVCQLCDNTDTIQSATGPDGFYAVFVPGGSTTVLVSIPAGTQPSPPHVGDTNEFSVVSGLPADGTATDFGFLTQTPPLACTIPAASEVISQTSWNKFNVPSGTAPVAWVHAQFKPTGVSAAPGSTVQFTDVSFVLNGIKYPMPDSVVNFDPNAPATSTTTFSGTPGTTSALWTTTINPNFISDENFIVGAAIPVGPAIAGGGQATIRFTTQTDDTGLAFSWQWSAAVYTYWPSDWNQALIQPYHGNGLHADTPVNTQVQKSLIQGPRGGGGSNFTGSWSATGHGGCPKSRVVQG